MPEVLEAIVGLAALKGDEGRPEMAQRWLRIAIAHPACPKRVQVEAAAIHERIVHAEIAGAIGEDDLHDPDGALASLVLVLLP
jgi:hypothetical protein